MPGLVRGDVLAANDARNYLPEQAESVETADYLLAFYPTFWSDPSQVLRTDSARDPAELIQEVLAHARERGRPDVVWWVHDLVRPTGLEDLLVARCGEPYLALTVLARALEEPLAPSPDEPEVRIVTDRASLEDDHRIGIEVFGEQMPPEEELRAELERVLDTQAEGVRMVAYLDGEPVGMGGVRVVDGVARLWGGGTVPAARRRGVYAAVLRQRLTWALDHGARFALTRGRVDTSAPLLRRAGFGDFGEKRGYRVLV